MDKESVIRGAISPFQKYCYGFNGASGKGYVLGFVLSAVKTKQKFAHPGSCLLDKTNVFDLAETAGTNMGQVNLIRVSSFCGPTGLIWGYHLVRPNDLYKKHRLGIEQTSVNPRLKVYSAQPLLRAFKALIGTVDKPHFPILPGSHLFSAYRTVEAKGPAHIFSSIAIGIAKNRTKHASVLIEDVGRIPLSEDTLKKQTSYKKCILQKLADSIVFIGGNEKIKFKEIFVDVVDIKIKKGEIGCALVSAPYITLAQQAVNLKGGASLLKIDINQWKELSRKNFLTKI